MALPLKLKVPVALRFDYRCIAKAAWLDDDYDGLKTCRSKKKMHGMTVESLPAKKEIMNDYVQYRSECVQQTSENKLLVITHLAVKEKIIPANQYKAVAESFSQVVKDENQKIVVRKM